ncbi:MAG: TSUP family transporter [Candidatus Dormibacteraeota bacterium]|nr:TSUP family transporter [Candidatus Dormibacteraeota bacterium]MDQ6792509.1 TSUP family transporter [Candidatus Dormibacteraeota bacterium]
MIGGALAIVAGLLVGTLSGLIGIGGGVLLVPIMVIGFGLAQQLAQGTSLAAILPTSIVAATTHYRAGNLELRAALLMGGTGAITAVLFGLLAQRIHPQVLARLFGAFLLFSAYRLWPRSSAR